VSLQHRTPQRSLPVRLCDIREDVRLRAARMVARQTPGDAELALIAAMRPSDRVYFVSRDAAGQLNAITDRRIAA